MEGGEDGGRRGWREARMEGGEDGGRRGWGEARMEGGEDGGMGQSGEGKEDARDCDGNATVDKNNLLSEGEAHLRVL
jgi:hypothetical protein